MLSLSTPVADLHMVGDGYAAKLKRLGITIVQNLLFHIPFRYEDYTITTNIASLQEGEHVSIIGTITSIKNIFTRGGTRIQQALVSDRTGQIDVTWYNQPFLIQALPIGSQVALAGAVKTYRHKLILEAPDYEVVRGDKPLVHTGRLVPIYPETEGLSSKWLRSRIFPLIGLLADQIPEEVPQSILDRYNLLPLATAIKSVHFPASLEEAQAGKRRICFDELLTLQLVALKRKKEWEENTKGIPFHLDNWKPRITRFIENLSFTLTNAQKRCIDEILADLTKTKPMNRLLEGDVGSGKTVVAAVAALLAVCEGYEVAFMAPTEILAHQHYQSMSSFMEKEKISVALITAKTKKQDLDAKIYIGTHALLSKSLSFQKLGLIIIDEQQRFGVTQRAILKEKGINPHMLSLTATPIPRTFALTLFADLDLSQLEEMPKGRIQIKTYAVGPDKRDAAYAWVRKKIIESSYKEQAYIVCPLIEESDSLVSVKAVKAEFSRLQNSIYADLKLGLLHGRMKATEKEKVLVQFKSAQIHILVSTPVVEVGIDIPNATIMLIEGADRFGLSQLHQLRGRVGRSDVQSYCVLLSDSQNEKTITRLKLLTKYHQGHVLAEYDLTLRGQGDIFGTAQHGAFGLKYADMENVELIHEAQKSARELLDKNPKLNKFPLLQAKLQKYTIQNIVNN